MTGIEQICERISKQAQDAANEILSRAAAEEATIRASYEQTAKQESETVLARGRAQAAEREARLTGVAELEAKKLHLKTKQSMIDQAFADALSALNAFPEDRRVKLLSALVAKAAVSGSERVVCSKEDRASIGAKIVESANTLLGKRGNLTLADETREMQGGVILAEGSMEINCTYETILRQLRDELSGEVAALLFQ